MSNKTQNIGEIRLSPAQEHEIESLVNDIWWSRKRYKEEGHSKEDMVLASACSIETYDRTAFFSDQIDLVASLIRKKVEDLEW